MYMGKIEVGEYVRTNKGRIGKVVEIRLGFNKDLQLYQDIYKLDNGLWTILDYIVKHSKQLIDLIEVGDIVRIRTGLYYSFMEFIDNEECLLILKEKVKEFWTIEEILAREQFEANCYKVGGEYEC